MKKIQDIIPVRNTVRNTVPHLLEALCNHPDCPEWFKDDIWDLMSNHKLKVRFDAEYWEWVIRSSEYAAKREREDAEDAESDLLRQWEEPVTLRLVQ